MTNTATRKSLKYIKDETHYYEHQVVGARKGARMTSFLLADEPGLGKSLQALTVAAIDFELGYAEKVLIVCPSTLKWNWAEEIEKHTNFSYRILEGQQHERFAQIIYFGHTEQILIINYEQVKPHLKELNKHNFDIIIYDEAHFIKNYKSQRSQACLKLKAKRHILLTGTPMLNQVNELWTLLHRVNPTKYPNYYPFINRYCNTPEAPIWMADGSFKQIKDIQTGDSVLGWELSSSGRRSLVKSIVENTHTRIAPEIVKVTLESGSVIKCTPDHVWLSGDHAPGLSWISLDHLTYKVGNGGIRNRVLRLSKIVDPLSELSLSLTKTALWLGGIYDGEGCRNFIAQSKQHNPEIYFRIQSSLDELEIPYTLCSDGIRLLGGRETWVKMLVWCEVSKRTFFESQLQTQLNRKKDLVVKIEPAGSGEVVSLQTSTGNYIAWGYASKNCAFGGYQNKQIIGVKNKTELHSALQEVMIRRLKKDVLDLPGKQYIQVMVDLHPKQRELYDGAMNDLAIELPDNPDPMELENALVKYLKLKQICGTTATIPGYPDESAKLDRAVELIREFTHNEDDSPSEPVVVFTQFRDVANCLANRLSAESIKAFQLNGDVDKSERPALVHKWADYKDPHTGRCGVLIFMLQLAVGINATAASRCIFLDKLYVPKLNEQAVDRLDRIGQTSTVQIYEIIARKTLEQRIESILKSKRKLFDTMVEESDWKAALYKALKDDE